MNKKDATKQTKVYFFILDCIDLPRILTMENNKRTYTPLRKTKLFEELWRLTFVKCYRRVDIEKLIQMCFEKLDKNDYHI